MAARRATTAAASSSISPSVGVSCLSAKKEKDATNDVCRCAVAAGAVCNSVSDGSEEAMASRQQNGDTGQCLMLGGGRPSCRVVSCRVVYRVTVGCSAVW